MGKGAGLLTFFCDAAKGWLAVVAGMGIAAHWAVHVPLPHLHERIDFLDPGYAGIAAAMGCILGHNFPLWLRFKGGKGVATSLGVITGMMPLAALCTFAVWGLVFKISRFASLASILAAIALPVIVLALMFLGPTHGWAAVHGWSMFYFACAAALLVIRRHRENIRRLVAGTESRFGSTPPPETPPS